MELGFLLGVLNGFIWGLLLALISIGLTLIFGVMRIINVAHGELYMVGAFLAWLTYAYLGVSWLALIVGPLVVGAISFAIERGILAPLKHEALRVVLATIGLMYIFQYTALYLFGGASKSSPPLVGGTFPIFGGEYPFYRVFLGVITVVVLGILWLFLQRTKFGLWIRASSQNKELALLVGIPSRAVYTITFVVGGILCSLGGILMTPIVSINFLMGIEMTVVAFIVVVIGGLGSLKGTLVAGLLWGVLEGSWSLLLTPAEARVVTFAILLMIFLLRPSGIFGGRP